MLVRNVRLNDFRNYSRAYFEFDPRLNIIIGKNGSGKTNILESILFVSNTKSFRSNDDKDLIKKDCDFARILLNSDENEFKVVISKKNKSLYIDDVLVSRTSQFIGKLNAILFKPDDLELFRQSPSLRRRLLDIEISKVSRNYMQALLKYNSLLKDKNRLLKELESDPVLLSVINESMVPLIKIIIEEREKFFAMINHSISDLYTRISGKEVGIELIYRKCCETKDILTQIEASREKDDYYHYTTFGPHHDDYYFRMGDYELNSIASQGQKRMALIAFKFALIHYIEVNTGKTPIVLLDDILSELDKENQERLLKMIPENTQVIITNTDIDHLNITNKYKLIELKEEGNV